MALIIGGPYDEDSVVAPDDMRVLLLQENGVRVAYRRMLFTRPDEERRNVCFVAPDISDADAVARFWRMTHRVPTCADGWGGVAPC